jgi:hypothetical protein
MEVIQREVDDIPILRGNHRSLLLSESIERRSIVFASEPQECGCILSGATTGATIGSNAGYQDSLGITLIDWSRRQLPLRRGLCHSPILPLACSFPITCFGKRTLGSVKTGAAARREALRDPS